MRRITRRGLPLRALLIGSTLVVGACRDDAPPTGPSAPPTPALTQAAQDPWPDPLLAYARAIPGFGGLFLDPNGVPTVYLTDLRQRSTAERVLGGELRRLGAATSQLRVVQGDYEYLQLHDWFTKAMPQALGVPGAVFMDVDEGTNRVRIGVATAAADAAVRGALARFAIPGAAVVIERTEPIHYAATLKSNGSPERGGLQITFSEGVCTLGFNTRVKVGFIQKRSFITNSHCTKTRGVVEGTQYHQPVVSGVANLIGTEVADPPFFTTLPCPPGRKCRWSDAARVLYPSSVASDLGGIARTTGGGSITIDPANPVFDITSETPEPLIFSTLNKMGRTTGWTAGVTFATCIAVNVNGTNNVNETNITMLCQDRVNASVGPGDSGSPVFSYSGSGKNVSLHGILWGGNAAGTYFIFSRMSLIESELGAMTTF